MKKLLLFFVATCMVGCIYTQNTKDSFDKGASGAIVFSRVSNNLALATNAADIVYKMDLYMRTTDALLKDSIRHHLLWDYRIEYHDGLFTLKGDEREWVIKTDGKPLDLGNATWVVDYRGPYGNLSNGVCMVRRSELNNQGVNVAIVHDNQGAMADNNSVLEISRTVPLEVLFKPNGDYWVEGSGQLASAGEDYPGGNCEIDFVSESPLLCGVTSYVDNLYAGVCWREGVVKCNVRGAHFENDKMTIKAYILTNSVYADVDINGVLVEKINMSSRSDMYW